MTPIEKTKRKFSLCSRQPNRTKGKGKIKLNYLKSFLDL